MTVSYQRKLERGLVCLLLAVLFRLGPMNFETGDLRQAMRVWKHRLAYQETWVREAQYPPWMLWTLNWLPLNNGSKQSDLLKVSAGVRRHVSHMLFYEIYHSWKTWWESAESTWRIRKLYRHSPASIITCIS